MAAIEFKGTIQCLNPFYTLCINHEVYNKSIIHLATKLPGDNRLVIHPPKHWWFPSLVPQHIVYRTQEFFKWNSWWVGIFLLLSRCTIQRSHYDGLGIFLFLSRCRVQRSHFKYTGSTGSLSLKRVVQNCWRGFLLLHMNTIVSKSAWGEWSPKLH